MQTKKQPLPNSTADGLLFFLIALFPFLYLIYATFTYDPVELPRFIFLTITAATGFLIFRNKFPSTVLVSVPLLFFIGYVVWSLASMFWAHNAAEALFSTLKQAQLPVYFLLLGLLLRTQPQLPIMVARALLLLAPVLLILFIKEISFTYHQAGINKDGIYLVSGFSGHKNLYATWLYCYSGIMVLGWLNDKSGWRKGYLPALFLTSFILFVLETRAALAGFAVFVAVAGISLMLFRKNMKEPVKKPLLQLSATIAISLMLSFAFYGMFDDGGRSIKKLNPSTFAESKSAKERYVLWGNSMQLFFDQPVTGVGAGNWKIEFPSKGLEGLRRAEKEETVFLQPHNDYLSVLSELGAVGFLLFFIPLITIVLTGFISLKSLSGEPLRIQIISLALLSGLALIAFFDFPKDRPELLLFLSLFLAISFHFATLEKNLLHTKLSVKKPILINAIIVICVFSIVCGVSRIKSEAHCVKLYKYRKQGNIEMMHQEALQANGIFNNLDPLVTPFETYSGIAAMSRENYAEAGDWFRKAYEKNPNLYVTSDNLAGMLVRTGKYEEALHYYEKLHSMAPGNENSLFNLAYTNAQMKNFEAAKQWLSKVTVNTERKETFLKRIASEEAAMKLAK